VIWPDSLTTERLLLRPPVDADASAVFERYARDPDVTRHLTWRPHTSPSETRDFLAHCRAGWESGSDLTWALTLRGGDDRPIGMIGLRPRGFKPDLGYVLAKPYWGQGLMTEAGRAIVSLAFSDPGVHRVWAVCDVENRASSRVLEKLGLTREGVLRRWIIHPNVSDEPRDCFCYARVRYTTTS
jgi:[ribosomal protein S5]-alanine N-acetyltransferase